MADQETADSDDGEQSETDDDTMGTLDALTGLTDLTGQSYMVDDHGWDHLAPFAADVTDEFAREHYPGEEPPVVEAINQSDRMLALSVAYEAELTLAWNARGIVNALPHQRVVTAADVSGLLVEALGGDRSDATMLGHGSTADVRHTEHVEILVDLSAYHGDDVAERIEELAADESEDGET